MNAWNYPGILFIARIAGESVYSIYVLWVETWYDKHDEVAL